jgi:hypothetical protein
MHLTCPTPEQNSKLSSTLKTYVQGDLRFLLRCALLLEAHAVCEVLALDVKLLPFGSFLQANGLLLILGTLFTRTCSCIQKDSPHNPAIQQLETQEEDENPYSPRPKMHTLPHRYGKTPSNRILSSPSPSKHRSARLLPSRKLTSAHGIKRLRVKDNPPHIQNKHEGGYGTLKRRDNSQPSHPVRAGYAVVQFESHSHLTMTIKEDARKASRATYKQNLHASVYPLGIHSIHNTVANVPRSLPIKAIRT